MLLKEAEEEEEKIAQSVRRTEQLQRELGAVQAQLVEAQAKAKQHDMAMGGGGALDLPRSWQRNSVETLLSRMIDAVGVLFADVTVAGFAAVLLPERQRLRRMAAGADLLTIPIRVLVGLPAASGFHQRDCNPF